MSGTQYKSLIGEEDLRLWEGGSDPTTFERATSTGASVTMTKFGASGNLNLKIEGATIETATVDDLITKAPWIDVRAYGAVGDGVTNDTTAIQSALTYAETFDRAVVWVPNGTFLLNAGLTIGTGTRLTGIGTLKFAAGVTAGTKMLTNSERVTGNSGIWISGLTLDGNRTDNSGSAGLTGIDWTMVTDSVVEKTTITGFTQHCIDASVGNADNLFFGNTLEDYGTGSVGFGLVLLSDSNRNRVIGNNVYTTNTNVGISVDDQSGAVGGTSCTGNIISDNDIWGGDYGILIVGSGENIVANNRIHYPTSYGIYVGASTDGLNDAVGNLVHGNTIDVDTGVNVYGLSVGGSANSFTENKVTGGKYGAYVTDIPASSMLTSGCRLSNNLFVSQSDSAVMVTGSSDLDIKGNKITAPGGHGIEVVTTNAMAMSGIRITENTVIDAQTCGVKVTSGATVAISEVDISNNWFLDGSRASSGVSSAILLVKGTQDLDTITMKGNTAISTGATVWARTLETQSSPTNLYVDGNHGIGFTDQTIGSGTSTSIDDGSTISHGLGRTPDRVMVTGSVAGEIVTVTAKGATTFTVAIKTHAGAAGTTQTVYWEAQ